MCGRGGNVWLIISLIIHIGFCRIFATDRCTKSGSQCSKALATAAYLSTPPSHSLPVARFCKTVGGDERKGDKKEKKSYSLMWSLLYLKFALMMFVACDH